MMWRRVVIVAVIWMMLSGVGMVSAHANLVKSDPPANATLDAPPAEIRLWFTEPLEADFSAIRLRDQDGNLLDLTSTVDPADPYQLVLVPGDLPDGLYTAAWRVVSAADGHPTLGSLAFIVGEAGATFNTAAQSGEYLPLDATAIRWVHLISLSIAVGGLAFMLFVWSPAVSEANPAVERRMNLLVWVGWLLIGLTSLLLTALLYAVATDNPLFANIDLRTLEQLIADTRFGHLRLAFTAQWVGMGLSLWFARGDKWFNPVALVLGFGLLLMHSLYSHANAARDLAASVGADWLHLTATAFWVGGLVQFVNVVGPVRRHFTPAAPVLSRLVGHFTNFARVSVAALIVTGMYSAWLQVGSLEGLLTTPYGQALLIKILLIIPLIGLGAVNLFFTSRHLAAGDEKWGSRLRGLMGAEIALTIGVLAAVGVMTSIAPARVTLDLRASEPRPPEPAPITETLTANELTAALEISPGWVGENTFTLTLTDADGAPVTDATLIRMRFEHQTANLGESELRPTAAGDGIYTVSGANLSVAGDWRIRTTIQRPDRFDTLVDFRPVLQLPPAPVQPPPPDPNAPLPYRTLALLVAGLLALLVGGFFLGENRFRPPRASSLLALGLVLVGGAFLLSGVLGTPGTATASVAYAPAPDDPIRLAVTSDGQNPLPYLITGGGGLLRPNPDATWSEVPLDAAVRDVYVDRSGVIWASTDKGFYEQAGGEWRQLSDMPVKRTLLMHGYFFAVGDQGITRVPAGGLELDRLRQLDVPLADQPALDLVMLGNHAHVVQNGGQVFLTNDLGLSWTPIDAPQPVESIGTDADGNLLAVSADGMRTWNYISQTWGSPTPLPVLPAAAGDEPVLRVFDGQLYVVMAGQLFRRASGGWEAVALPESGDAYLTALEFQYPTTLWALDAKGKRLWTTIDGQDWRMIPVARSES